MGDYRCFACFLHYKDGLGYNCSLCNFNLDLKCASNWSNILKNDCHDHEFTVLAKQMQLCCDACGQGGHEVSYLCSVSQLLVHKECISLPRHIRITLHQHPLKLTIFREAIVNYNDQVCKPFIPRKKICGVYYCEHCNYVAHNTCVIKEDVLDETTEMEQENQDPYATTIETIDHDSKNMILIADQPAYELNLEHNQLELGAQIKHFYISDRITTCHCCIRPITVTDAFYSCTEQQSCHFFLHKTCAQLPTQRLHPFHPHPLKLPSRAPKVRSTGCVFECDLCRSFSQGFLYSCERYDFYLDLQCSFLSDSFTR
ncbi:unnamed protein product [Prunus brigantina]